MGAVSLFLIAFAHILKGQKGGLVAGVVCGNDKTQSKPLNFLQISSFSARMRF